ncbi:MAG: hypothetical protein QWI36_02085 [Wolbachia endosymbiont of Tyrophagus putrescentiae]|nr:hypothetical protein [Wolbachia endosymbiont of Tyrophagus putrescentiae]
MNPILKKFLVICCCVALFIAAVVAATLFEILLDKSLNMLYALFLAKTSSEVLAFFGLIAALFAVGCICYFTHKVCATFTEKITNNYQSFRNENSDDNIFSEVCNDPTISPKDKILFFSIYSIYCIQLPFLYCASKISSFSRILVETRILGARIALVLLNAIVLIPVVLLELIKYPLVKFFSPLGLNVKQLSFLFNVSDVRSGSQSIHTSSFEHSIIDCALELKSKHGDQRNVLDKELEDYINKSDELTIQQKGLLELYLNFNNSNSATWKESKSGLTITQAANLVLIAAREQKLDMDLLKCMLLMRLQEGNGKCNLGMFNRVIYSLSCLEAKNNFTVEVNSHVYEKMPEITQQFLQKYNCKKMRILKDNFDNFYFNRDIDPPRRESINESIEDARQYVFSTLYKDYYDKYGKEVGRGPIKHKLKELITGGDIKEAISSVIDKVNIPETPPTFLERVKILFRGQNVQEAV